MLSGAGTSGADPLSPVGFGAFCGCLIGLKSGKFGGQVNASGRFGCFEVGPEQCRKRAHCYQLLFPWVAVLGLQQL